MASPPDPPRARVTLSDVARAAQVSLATADRVLNNRPGVHARSIARVNEAIARLGYRPDPVAARLARGRAWRVAVVLPLGSDGFVARLREALRDCAPWLADQRAQVELLLADVGHGPALAERLAGLEGQCDALVLMAREHPAVQQAVDRLAERGTVVVALVNDLPRSRRHHFVGIDNLAAGRTAASLMGRFATRGQGEVGVIVDSLSLAEQAERHLGFSQVMAAEFGALRVLPPLSMQEREEPAGDLARRLLDGHAGLVGIYGAGPHAGSIARALREAGRAREVVFIAHELDADARAALLNGSMHAAIGQDPGHELRSALRLAVSRLTREPLRADQERIRIEIHLRDNLP